MATGAFGVRMVGMTQLQGKLDKAARRGIRGAIMASIELTCRVAEKRVKVRYSGDPIKVRSGLTRASIRTQLTPARLEGRVGSSTRHTATLEFGATITPKRAKVLTIPLAAAKTAAGKSRGTARQVGAMYSATFWRKFPGQRNPILYGVRAGASRKQAGPQLVPLFVGVKRVVIRGKHVFRDEADKIGGAFIHNAVTELGKVL